MEKKNVESGEILLEVKNLKKYYPVRTGFIKKTELKAVDDAVSYTHLTLPTN